MMLSTIFTHITHSNRRNVLVFDPMTAEKSENENIALLITAYRVAFPTGLLFSDNVKLQDCDHFQPLRSTQAYLGMTTDAVLLDIRTGFPLDYFLSISATIKAGGLLVLIKRETFLIDESQRFHQEAIETPFFHDFLQNGFHQYCYHWHNNRLIAPALDACLFDSDTEASVPIVSVTDSPEMNSEQEKILKAFLKEESGIFTLFSARGTGKSWLASRIIETDATHYILTAPNQNAINQYQGIEQLQFRAPDALFLTIPEGIVYPQTLMIEEAAKMPLSHLERLCSRFQKVLMISSVENYEGTGQGLREKIHDLVEITEGYQLTTSQRFLNRDPLKSLGDMLMFVKEDESAAIADISGIDLGLMQLRYYDQSNIDLLRSNIGLVIDLYHLLNQTHYQTNVQDIRRLLDAPHQVFILAFINDQLIGAVWGIEEGGLSLELSQAVFEGLRRPKGNLVAQMLTSQSYFPEAMQARSIRISRISVIAQYRRQGIGTIMTTFLEAHITDQRQDIHFISVSFGLTADLLLFWESLGYQLVHLGFHLDKTTGLYAAVVLKEMQTGHEWISEAVNKFGADAYLNLKQKTYKDDIYNILNEKAKMGLFDLRDQRVIKVYQDSKRGEHTVKNAFIRLES